MVPNTNGRTIHLRTETIGCDHWQSVAKELNLELVGSFSERRYVLSAETTDTRTRSARITGASACVCLIVSILHVRG